MVSVVAGACDVRMVLKQYDEVNIWCVSSVELVIVTKVRKKGLGGFRPNNIVMYRSVDRLEST